jgi:outer membrane PBP1 activator LpoA protein
MKRKEREHLKEDPFQQFIQKVLEILTRYKKEIFIGLGAAVALVVIVLVIALIRAGSVAKENKIYSDAINIQNNEKLSVDQKIEQLGKLKTKKGISASAKLFLASLHFQKGEIDKAGEVIKGLEKNSSNLISGKKKLLEAEILNASDKTKEALDLLNSMLADPKSQIPKDFVLLRMAKIQTKNGQMDTAITNLNKLIEEYPQSSLSTEARNLLKDLEKN